MRAGLLHEGLEAWAERTPDAPAVITPRARLTFAELRRRANALAAELVERGAARDHPIAVVAEKGWQQVVASLAVLEAGAPYLPVDAELPPDRVQQLLRLGESRLVVTLPHLAGRLDPPEGTEVVTVPDGPPAGDLPAPAVDRAADALAYVLFTSGSTGTPKGVMIEHRAALNTTDDVTRRFGVTSADRVLGLSSMSFDLSVYDTFGVLGAGGALVLPDPADRRDARAWARLMVAERVTVWNTVPALMELLVNHLEQGGAPVPPLRLALLAGDWIPLGLPARMQALFPGIEIINLGGATEAAIFSSWFRIERVEPDWDSIPFGHPLAGQDWHVLDDDLGVCPEGETGQLHISGKGLARGYWGDPERTERSFIVHPRTGDRLYRTGDLGLRRPDGTIEFLGRMDTQVKIHGYRIELGEIEATLQRHPAVGQVAAVAIGPRRHLDRIVAFWTPVPGAPAVEPAELAAFVAGRLPEYMVPAAFHARDALPLTGNGKVDRLALAAEAAAQAPADTGRPPESDTERRLAALVCEVVGLDVVGAAQNLFDIGMQSLTAAQLVARLRHELALDLPLSFVLQHPTVEAMAAALDGQAAPAPMEEPASADAAGPAPLSFGQEQVWFLDRLVQGGNRAYHFQCTIDLEGRLEPELLRQALTDLVRRHEILRTVFVDEDGDPVQVVMPPYEVELPEEDLRAEGPGAFEERLEAELDTAFDLGRLPLIRWRLYRLADERWVLSDVEHHLVHDGWSVGVMYREVGELYSARVLGREPSLPELEVQFRDLVAWQRERYRGERRRDLLERWTERLRGVTPLELPTGRPRPRFQRFDGAARRFVLPADLYERLRTVSREHGCSLFTTMLTAFLVLLHRYTGREDLPVGSWMANRDTRPAEQVIGMLVNSVVLRARVTPDRRFADLLTDVRRTVFDAYAIQDAPFDDVVRAVAPPRDTSRNPLAQVFFSFHDSPVPELDWPGVRGRLVERSNRSAKFDLNVIVIPQAEQRRVAAVRPDRDELAVLWEYNTDLFEPGSMERMFGHFARLLAAAAADPAARVADLPVLTEDERRQLDGWNRAEAPFPDGETVVDLVDRQVRSAPDAPAVADDREELTYRELDERVRRTAAALREAGVRRGDRVAVCMERSVDLVAGLLAVARTGAAWVPLDPDHPPARHGVILEDAGAAVLLTERRLAGRFGSPGPRLLYADALEVPAGASEAGVPRAAGPGDVAYVVHTSGSTGRPKGVAVTHRSLVNLLWAMRAQLGTGPDDALLAVTTVSFDIAALELLLPLAAGARTIVASRETAADGERLRRQLEGSGATLLQATPITWRLLLEAGWEGGRPLVALCGGERLPRRTADELLTRCTAVWNVYGPTETTIWSTAQRVEPGSGPVPIGRPLANTTVHVLDASLRPLPVGVPGELWIGGAGVALGYLGQPGTTAERFLPDPFGAAGGRLYRTGDLVRRLESGELEFVARVDRQVKVRGHRIELEEVEAVLDRHPDVLRSVADVREGQLDEERELVAYVVPRSSAVAPDTAALTDFVRRHLPAYMVPRPIVPIEEVPVSAHGKVDRARLPAPEAAAPDRAAAVAPAAPPAPAVDAGEEQPDGELEQQLIAIWSDVLRRPPSGVDDDFFELGGHSLLALRMASRVRARLRVMVSIEQVFDHPTVRSLAALIRSMR